MQQEDWNKAQRQKWAHGPKWVVITSIRSQIVLCVSDIISSGWGELWVESKCLFFITSVWIFHFHGMKAPLLLSAFACITFFFYPIFTPSDLIKTLSVTYPLQGEIKQVGHFRLIYHNCSNSLPGGQNIFNSCQLWRCLVANLLGRRLLGPLQIINIPLEKMKNGWNEKILLRTTDHVFPYDNSQTYRENTSLYQSRAFLCFLDIGWHRIVILYTAFDPPFNHEGKLITCLVRRGVESTRVTRKKSCTRENDKLFVCAQAVVNKLMFVCSIQKSTACVIMCSFLLQLFTCQVPWTILTYTDSFIYLFIFAAHHR